MTAEELITILKKLPPKTSVYYKHGRTLCPVQAIKPNTPVTGWAILTSDEAKSTPPKNVVLNATQDGIAPTIRANYWKMSEANFIHTDGRKAPCVIEIYEQNNPNPSSDKERICRG